MPIVLDPTWTLAPNPRLWLDMATLGSDDPSYAVGVAPPEGAEEWIDYSQFCSVLAADWLVTGRPAAWGLSDYGAGGAVAAAQQLIAFQEGGLPAQVAYAQAKLNAEPPADAPPATVSNDTGAIVASPQGTLIWAGSEVHAVSAYVAGDDKVQLYDPDEGTSETVTRERFQQMIEVQMLATFVSRQLG